MEGENSRQKAANSNGWAWTIFMPASSYHLRLSPRLFSLFPSPFSRQIFFSAFLALLFWRMHRQIWLEAARPPLPPSFSSENWINLRRSYEITLSIDFIEQILLHESFEISRDMKISKGLFLNCLQTLSIAIGEILCSILGGVATSGRKGSRKERGR